MNKPRIPQPLKWHGGKYYLAKKFIALMPEHTHYVEPYFGGGAVLLNKDPVGVSEVINDLNGDLTNFWRVLQDEKKFAKFQRSLEAMPFSQVEWDEAVSKTPKDPVENAINFFVRCRQSRAGKFDAFAPLSKTRVRRTMNEQASAWMSAVEGLPQVASRLKRVVVLNQDALDVIRKEDNSKTLFYLDPPYLHETRVTTKDYEHEMSSKDHLELLSVLLQLKGKVMLSGYPNKLYASMLKDWKCKKFQIDNKASSAKVKPVKTECLWMNF